MLKKVREFQNLLFSKKSERVLGRFLKTDSFFTMTFKMIEKMKSGHFFCREFKNRFFSGTGKLVRTLLRLSLPVFYRVPNEVCGSLKPFLVMANFGGWGKCGISGIFLLLALLFSFLSVSSPVFSRELERYRNEKSQIPAGASCDVPLPVSSNSSLLSISDVSSLPPQSGSVSSLGTDWKSPGDPRLVSGEDSRPWVYYWWLKGNVSEEMITKDLEAMRKQGIGGILLVDSRGYYDDANTTKHVPVPLEIKYEFMSPEWRKMVRHLVSEARRLGMQVSMNIANTGGQLRGPWDLGADGPKELTWTEGNLNGPKRVEIPLTVPKETRFFQDVAILGVRVSTPVDKEGRESIRLNETWMPVANPQEGAAQVAEVVDLKEFVREINGVPTLIWDVPDGAWKVLRFASRVVGDVGSVDILSREAVTRYFQLMCGQIIADVGLELAGAGKTLTHFYNVSWEGSDPNWTSGLAERFQEEHGYELWNNLPVLRGLIVGSLEESQRFTEDYFRTVSNAFRENCYLTIGELCRKFGMIWHSEDGGPWSRGKTAWMGNFHLFAEADMLTFWGQNDVIQGEFWVREPKEKITEPSSWPVTRSNARYASMAAHIYGKPLVSMEAFTHMAHHWTQYPAHLKPAADENFIDGANMFIWHTFTASPDELGTPGFEYFAGTHLNRKITWWEQSRGILRYLEKCQNLLRKGTFTADVCVYVSDKNYVGWGHGESWNPDSNLIPGKGWKFDLLDTRVLVEDLKFRQEDGLLVLPHGMNYRILVVDPLRDEPIPAEALEKVWELAEAGAVVVLGENVPKRNPGLSNISERDAALAALTEKLWGDGTARCASVGKGRIYRKTLMEDVLAMEKILADFESEDDVRFIHLRDDEYDRYFIAGSGTVSCVFRASGRPVIFDPVSEKNFQPVAYALTEDGRTCVTIQLPVNGSVFVIFPKKESGAEKHFTDIREGGDDSLEWLGRTDDTAKFRLWKNGCHVLAVNDGTERVIEARPPMPLTLNEDWELRFDPDRGGPIGSVHFPKLVCWNERSEPEIRYFSGTCSYSKKVTLKAEEAKRPARLSLGEVYCVAEVRVNGEYAGLIWTAPWTAELTGKLKPGENLIEIDVTNTWVNRLIGDAALPKEKRVSKTNVYLLPEKNEFRAWQGFFASDPLRPAGLKGPVEIQFAEEIEVKY